MENELNCTHHSKPLDYFCETCKELACDDCMLHGPHQTKNHNIIELEQAYASREQYIRDRIEVGLRAKREQLIQHTEEIDKRMHEIENQKIIIEKDIQMEFEGGIIKRLNDTKGHKLAVLQSEVAKLQKGINEIDDFIYTFEYLALTEENVLPLLFMSKTLSKELMRLLSIIIKTNISVTPFELPRELLQLRVQLKNIDTSIAQINFRKEVLWKLREKLDADLANDRKQFFEKMEQEIWEWVTLLKNVCNSFDQLCLICGFCGCFLSSDIINEDCLLNSKSYNEVQLTFKCFTSEEPSFEKFGTLQHFFGNPKQEYLVFRKDKYPDFGEYYEQKKAAKEIYLKIFRTLWFSIVDLKAKKYLNSWNLKEIFAKYDKENEGLLSVIRFKYLLHHEFGMRVDEVESFVNYFKEEKEDKIKYKYFLEADWYLEELARLEEQLKKDAGRYKKLYQRGKTMTTMNLTSSTIRNPISSNQNNSNKFESLRPIYTKEIRFSKPKPEEQQQPLQQSQIGFGFGQRSTIKKDQHVRFNENKSQSPAGPASRFLESNLSDNSSYHNKYYQQ